MDAPTFKKRGIVRDDVQENIGAVLDTVMSINPNFGQGHSKAYFKQYLKREREFIAHAFENTFGENPVFKKYMPELYEEMIEIIKDLEPL